jgi:hypothetical protein
VTHRGTGGPPRTKAPPLRDQRTGFRNSAPAFGKDDSAVALLDWCHEHADDVQDYAKKDIAAAIGRTVKTLFNAEQRVKAARRKKNFIH